MTTPIKVEQVDRESAADFARAEGNWLLDWDAIRRGDLDGTVFVQSFARQRLASEAKAFEEAIAAVRARRDELTGDRRSDDELRFEMNTAITRIGAIRSRIPETDNGR